MTQRAFPLRSLDLLQAGICLLVLLLAVLLGSRSSPLVAGAVIVVIGAVALLRRPLWGLFALIPLALLARLNFGTGTDVSLNPATLFVPTLFGVWVLVMAGRRDVRFAPSRVNSPLALFLLCGVLSLLVGNAMWDPAIPRPGNFTLVQLGQWAIFAFSAAAFWLAANLVQEEATLRRLTFTFLALSSVLALIIVALGVQRTVNIVTTGATYRTPFWVLIAALAGGQLVFNRKLSTLWRVFLAVSLLAVLIFAFVQQRQAVSNWVGVGTVAASLTWLRFRRLRVLVVALVIALALGGLLFPALYRFGGGDMEWERSGGSRLALSKRVIEVTMRNPITGLGPAAYRPYTRLQSFQYGSADWLVPKVNSHNNYVDLFSHTGLLGLGLFLWFMAEVAWLGWRLCKRFATGFAAGYVNGMLAAWVSIMVIMMLLDWFLPFVYNVSFEGFQASGLVWMFMGGLVALEQMAQRTEPG